ncbi:hypothetical protein TSAR_009244, partial [Trichomalopsis sarcophagae]
RRCSFAVHTALSLSFVLSLSPPPTLLPFAHTDTLVGVVVSREKECVLHRERRSAAAAESLSVRRADPVPEKNREGRVSGACFCA